MPTRLPQLIFLLFYPLAIAGCGRHLETPARATTGAFVSLDNWYFESYDAGIVTVKHAGLKFRAQWESSDTWNARSTRKRHIYNLMDADACTLAADLVGTSVQDAEVVPGKQFQVDAKGYYETVLYPGQGRYFDVQRWGVDKTGLRVYVIDFFQITSITGEQGESPSRHVGSAYLTPDYEPRN